MRSHMGSIEPRMGTSLRSELYSTSAKVSNFIDQSDLAQAIIGMQGVHAGRKMISNLEQRIQYRL